MSRRADVVTCLTNSKTGLLFLALFPQFTPRESGSIFVIAVLVIAVLAGTVDAASLLHLPGLGVYVIATGLHGVIPLVLEMCGNAAAAAALQMAARKLAVSAEPEPLLTVTARSCGGTRSCGGARSYGRTRGPGRTRRLLG